MRNLDPKFLTPLFTKSEINAKIQVLAAQLDARYHNQDIVVVGVLNGALFFVADLIRAMKTNVVVDFISCSSYQGTKTSNELIIQKGIVKPVANKPVILIEDILDTGNTLSQLVKYVQGLNPASLEVITLVDKPTGHPTFTYPYQSLFEIGDSFIVGYGFDCDDHYRNLEDIYVYSGE